MSETSTATTTLPQLLSQRQRLEGGTPRVRFHATPDWQQGRTTFGGLLSLLVVQAMRDVCGTDWPLRALQTNFVGPVSPGPFDVEITLLRQGKNIRQVQARVLQADASGTEHTCGVLLGVFGAGRESRLPELRPSHEPAAKDPDRSLKWPYVPNITPAFTQHIEFRQAEGGLPFTGAAEWHSRVYTRIHVIDDVDSELQSVMLADAGATPALARISGFVPASTVSWSLELLPVKVENASGFWRMDKEALATSEGYVNEKTTLWTPDGEVAAFGYQVVAVYG
jgi:acyl-CoA thioesterase